MRKEKNKKKTGTKKRVNALINPSGLFHILWKSVLWKIGKGRVKRNANPKDSKVCAGNTCTPCEGAAPPSTPHAFGSEAYMHPRQRYCITLSVKTTPVESVIIKCGTREAGLSLSAYMRAKLLADFGETEDGGAYE